MDIIESIGWLTIIFIVGYALLFFLSKKERLKRENGKLIDNNEKCQKLINDYNQSIIKNKPIMTHNELSKKLEQIISRPEEVQIAIERIKSREDLQKRLDQKIRDSRKVGYKYEIEIFEIFDNNREILKQELLDGIKLKFNLDEEKALELFRLWKENNLIGICNWDRRMWQVGDMLTDEYYNLDNNDMTRKKWLKMKGIALKSVSEKYYEYYKDEEFPF